MGSSPSSGFDLREVVDGLREAFTARMGERSAHGSAHGDIRRAILAALEHEPKNGHQIIQHIVASSDGMWTPSAGTVYPNLQLLTDEGLISAQHDGERTVYALTEAGREVAAASSADEHERTSTNGWGDWSDRVGERWTERTSAVPRAGAKLAQAAAQVTHSGTREQQERAAALLDETRRKLYAILAED